MSKLPPLPTIDGHLFIDNSHWVEPMMSCHRKLLYTSIFGRISAGEKSALNFGTCIHIALEYRYVKYQNRQVDDQYYTDIGEMFTKFYEDHPPEETDFRTMNWCLEVVRKYNEKYTIEEFQLLHYNPFINCPVCKGKGFLDEENEVHCKWCETTTTRKTMVEIPFSLPLFSTKHPLDGSPLHINYTGRIDLPILLDGGLWVMDHKTSKSGGDLFWTEQAMTAQHRGYAWAFKQITKTDLRGYVVDMIRTSPPPQYVLNGTMFKGKSKSPQDWWNESLQRQRFYVDDQALMEWRDNVIKHVEMFLWDYKHARIPQEVTYNTKACSMYGRCEYMDVCKLAATDRGLFLASGQYTDNKWSPLNK